MASLITALSGASTSLPPMINKTLYPPPSPAAGYLVRSGGGCLLREKKPRWIRRGKVTVPVAVAAAAVKAMGGEGGGAKFKGTQMREKQLTEMIEKKVMEAKEACEGDERSDECKVAWDEVEEVSQAKADLRLKLLENHDPLESFCHDHPETEECLIYED